MTLHEQQPGHVNGDGDIDSNRESEPGNRAHPRSDGKRGKGGDGEADEDLLPTYLGVVTHIGLAVGIGRGNLFEKTLGACKVASGCLRCTAWMVEKRGKKECG